MSEKVAQKAGVPGIVALAAVIIVLYSLWGASLLTHEREARASANSAAVAVAK